MGERELKGPFIAACNGGELQRAIDTLAAGAGGTIVVYGDRPITANLTLPKLEGPVEIEIVGHHDERLRLVNHLGWQ